MLWVGDDHNLYLLLPIAIPSYMVLERVDKKYDFEVDTGGGRSHELYDGGVARWERRNVRGS